MGHVKKGQEVTTSYGSIGHTGSLLGFGFVENWFYDNDIESIYIFEDPKSDECEMIRYKALIGKNYTQHVSLTMVNFPTSFVETSYFLDSDCDLIKEKDHVYYYFNATIDILSLQFSMKRLEKYRKDIGDDFFADMKENENMETSHVRRMLARARIMERYVSSTLPRHQPYDDDEDNEEKNGIYPMFLYLLLPYISYIYPNFHILCSSRLMFIFIFIFSLFFFISSWCT